MLQVAIPPPSNAVIEMESPLRKQVSVLPNQAKDLIANGHFMNKGIVPKNLEPNEAYKEIKNLYNTHNTNYDIIDGSSKQNPVC